MPKRYIANEAFTGLRNPQSEYSMKVLLSPEPLVRRMLFSSELLIRLLLFRQNFSSDDGECLDEEVTNNPCNFTLRVHHWRKALSFLGKQRKTRSYSDENPDGQ